MGFDDIDLGAAMVQSYTDEIALLKERVADLEYRIDRLSRVVIAHADKLDGKTK